MHRLSNESKWEWTGLLAATQAGGAYRIWGKWEISKLILKSEIKVVLKDKLKLLKIFEKQAEGKKQTIIQIKDTNQFPGSRQKEYKISLFSCFSVLRQKKIQP